MTEAVLAPRGLRFALGALTFFGAGGVLIGGLQAGGARQIATATDGTVSDMVIGGIAIAAIGLFVLIGCIRQWRAIDRIRVDDDGTWVLTSRAGAKLTIPPEVELRLALRCRRVYFTWGTAPRIRDVVDGWLTAGSVRRRLAWSGPRTYDQALGQLGLAGGAPRRGEDATYERPRAA